jgi:hypothetical protein
MNSIIGTCMYNHGRDLGEPERGSFFSASTPFELLVDKEYRLFGMGLFKSTLLVLLRDETGLPNWLPMGLFSIGARKLPSNWEFILLDGEAASGGRISDRWTALWGYSELVRNRSHSDDLIERMPEALEVFYKVQEMELG